MVPKTDDQGSHQTDDDEVDRESFEARRGGVPREALVVKYEYDQILSANYLNKLDRPTLRFISVRLLESGNWILGITGILVIGI